MKTLITTLALALLLTACGDDKPTASAEPIATIPADARDYFNQMGVSDTGGSTGQVRRSDSNETVWFDSVRTTLTYLHLPETANQPLTAYISTFEPPAHWLPVEDAWFVQTPQSAELIGKEDYFPFPSEEAAQAFANVHQGKVLRGKDISAADLGL